MPDKCHGGSVNPIGAAMPRPRSILEGSEQLASIRAEERKRIGQDLHNSACQLLAVLQLNLGRMRRQGIDELEATIAECEQIIGQVGFHLRRITTTDPS